MRIPNRSHAVKMLLAMMSLVIGLTAGCATNPPALPATVTAGGPDLHFEPHGLYGYINGGAELFLEFGFTSLDVRNYRVTTAAEDGANPRQIDVETYRMADPPAAQGIYLAKCGDENPAVDVVARNTGNPYQITAVAGSLFLQVNNFSGDAACLPAMTALANAALAAENETPPLAIWRHLPSAGRVAGSEFLFRGRFGLEPVFTFGPGDVLQIEGQALGAGASYDNGDGSFCRRLTVEYPDAVAARRALVHLQDNLDAYLEVIDRNAAGLIFKDYAGQYGIVRHVDRRLDMAVRLTDVPPPLTP